MQTRSRNFLGKAKYAKLFARIQAEKCEVATASESESRTGKAKGMQSGAIEIGSDNGPIVDNASPRRRCERDWRVAEAFKYGKSRCECCTWTPPIESILHAHHVIPISCGGPDAPENLVLLCPNCHALAHYVAKRSNLTRRYSGPTQKAKLFELIAKSASPYDLAEAQQAQMLERVRPLIDSLRRPA